MYSLHLFRILTQEMKFRVNKVVVLAVVAFAIVAAVYLQYLFSLV